MERIWINDPAREGDPLRAAWSPGAGNFQPPQDLVFVSSGDAALTRRLTPVAVYEVMVKPRRRGYSQRCGFLIRPEELQAASEALATTEKLRARRREYSQQRRAGQEAAYQDSFRAEAQRQFPRVPAGVLDQIVARATAVGSRRVGRSRQLDLTEAVFLAVQAWVRHHRTKYERLLGTGVESPEARAMVRDRIDRVLQQWGWTGSDSDGGAEADVSPGRC